jgi:general transcriptional corepressor TUP1
MCASLLFILDKAPHSFAVTGQVNELNIIRQTLYQLEDEHRKIRLHYEEELRKTKQQFADYKARVEGPTREGIASLGRGDRDRDRDRDRERDRDRDRDRERDRDTRIDREPSRDPMTLAGPQHGDMRDMISVGRSAGLAGAPQEGPIGTMPHMTPVGIGVGVGPGVGGGYSDPFYGRLERDRDREREIERERMGERAMRDGRAAERERMERDRERDRDIRGDKDRGDVKRIKTERGKMDRQGTSCHFALCFTSCNPCLTQCNATTHVAFLYVLHIIKLSTKYHV